MNVWTIGFTKTSAERFFGQLQASGAQRLVDVRLNNVSQLAGRPAAHMAHAPHDSNDSTTWSPTATLVTSGATATTSPAPSWPSTTGGGNMIVPFRTDTSLWQRPAASMRTRTSPARRSRTRMSDSTDAAVPSHTIALMVRTLPGG